jgi:hypothetical protein
MSDTEMKCVSCHEIGAGMAECGRCKDERRGVLYWECERCRGTTIPLELWE